MRFALCWFNRLNLVAKAENSSFENWAKIVGIKDYIDNRNIYSFCEQTNEVEKKEYYGIGFMHMIKIENITNNWHSQRSAHKKID